MDVRSRKPAYIGFGALGEKFALDARSYTRIKSRKKKVNELVSISASNSERAGTDKKPTLRKFSWQEAFATEENLGVIASLASLCGRGNMYDRIGNSAFSAAK